MDEYAALAQRFVLSMTDVRGCLVLSRDGLVLGAYPGGRRDRRQAGLAEVRDARRGPEELRRARRTRSGRTSSGGPTPCSWWPGRPCGPGVLIDQLEQALLDRRGGPRPDASRSRFPTRPPRPPGSRGTPLHPRPTRARAGRRAPAAEPARRSAPLVDEAARDAGRDRRSRDRAPGGRARPRRARPPATPPPRSTRRPSRRPRTWRQPRPSGRRSSASPSGSCPPNGGPRTAARTSRARSTASCWPKSSRVCFRRPGP